MKRLAVFGSGGHARVVGDLASVLGWDSIKFFDENLSSGNTTDQLTIAGKLDDLLERSNDFDGVHIAIGNNAARQNVFRLLKGVEVVSLIHPSAVISSRASVGVGVLIAPNVVVNAHSFIGSGAIVNTSSSIDHDCYIKDFVHVSPGAHLAGGVCVGERTWVGIGTSIIQGVNLGRDVIIGAGSTVLSDMPDGMLAVGSPCKVVKDLRQQI